MSRKILVPVDVSATTLKAARHAGEKLRDEADARVTLLHVVNFPPALLEHGGASLEAEEERIEARMEQARREWLEKQHREAEATVFAPARQALLEAAGEGRAPTIETKVAGNLPEGDVARTIADEIEDGGYDAIVLGHRHGEKHTDEALGDLAEDIVAEHPGCEVWLAG